MPPGDQLKELLELAQAHDLEVRSAPFARPGRSAGGLCLLRGRRLVLLDSGAPLVEQVGALAEALMDALGPQAAIPTASPAIQQALAAAARRRWGSDHGSSSALARRVSVLRRPKPGLRAVRPR